MKKSMLWVLAAILICGIGMLSSCNKFDQSQDNKNSMDYLREDYAAVVAAYPEFEGRFVEARYELNGLLSETNADLLKPVTVDCYFYRVCLEGEAVTGYEVVELLRNFETGEREMEKYELEMPWWGDQFITSLDNYISLEKAIGCAYAANCIKPASKYVVFRNPVHLTPAHEDCMYIFGDGEEDGLLYIDAVTGRVIATPDENLTTAGI